MTPEIETRMVGLIRSLASSCKSCHHKGNACRYCDSLIACEIMQSMEERPVVPSGWGEKHCVDKQNILDALPELDSWVNVRFIIESLLVSRPYLLKLCDELQVDGIIKIHQKQRGTWLKRIK